MSSRTAITVHRSREEVQRLWSSSDHRPRRTDRAKVRVTFKDAPGDRGTEIHVDLGAGGLVVRLPEVVQSVVATVPLAKVKDDLRHFKQLVETGEIPRSDAVPEGERFERKFKQRPAQPLERQQAGA
jgi:uncharacterized membrane protein